MKGEKYFTGKPCLNGHIAERYVATGQCLTCKKEKVLRLRITNPDGYNEEKRKSAEKAKKLSKNKWYREKINKYAREWAKKNPEKIRAKRRAYKKTESHKIEKKRHKHRRRALKREGSYDKEHVLLLLYRQNHKCAICKIMSIRKKYDIDHILALCNGGTNNHDNLQLVCKACHIEKSKEDYKTWLKSK